MFNDTRSLKVEAMMTCCTFPDSRNLERKTRCKTATLVFIFRVKLSYPPHLASLYITCHILLVWLSVAGTVMMWGGKKKSTVRCGTSLGGQYEILLRSSPVGVCVCGEEGGAYIFLSHQPVLGIAPLQYEHLLCDGLS